MEKMRKSEELVAIIGMGYVGLPLALASAQSGFRVLGIDVDSRKIDALRDGRSHVDDVSNSSLIATSATGLLQFSNSYNGIGDASIVVICVPTPLKPSRDPDTSYIEGAVRDLSPQLRPGTLVILESTTYPGTTRALVVAPLEHRGLVAGTTVNVAFSPERVDPGNASYNIFNTPKVVGGLTPACTQRAADFYRHFVKDVVTVDSPEEAEMVKILENTFRAVNIALVNEFALLAHRMKVNIWNVIRAASSKPFGYMPFYPGPGVGGHCIPLDPLYLSWQAKKYDFFTRFIETASDINANMPRVIVERLTQYFNLNSMVLNGATVVVGGISYKKDISDARESPALEIIRLLRDDYMVKVKVFDPVAAIDPHTSTQLAGVEILDHAAVERATDFDALLLITPHSKVDWLAIARKSKISFDTRNHFKPSEKTQNMYLL